MSHPHESILVDERPAKKPRLPPPLLTFEQILQNIPVLTVSWATPPPMLPPPPRAVPNNLHIPKRPPRPGYEVERVPDTPLDRGHEAYGLVSVAWVNERVQLYLTACAQRLMQLQKEQMAKETEIRKVRQEMEDSGYEPNTVDSYGSLSKLHYLELKVDIDRLFRQRQTSVRKVDACVRRMRELEAGRDRYEATAHRCRDYLATHPQSRVYQTASPGEPGLCLSPLEEGGEDLMQEAWSYYMEAFLGKVTTLADQKWRDNCRTHQLNRLRFFQHREELEQWLLELTMEIPT